MKLDDLPSAEHAPIVLSGLTRRFGERVVLDGLNLSIPAGQFLAVVGRSGCGKSTLLRLLAGLDRADGGELRQPAQQSVRVMFQEARLLPWKSVLDNVALGLAPAQREQARDALAEVGLADRADEWPARLSGGQRQRVALARALVHQPRLLLLDEPLGALDALTRLDMQGLIERLWLAHRCTTVLVTHDVGEAVNLASRIEALSLRGQVLISDSTYQRCWGLVSASAPMQVFVKGRTQPVSLRELIAIPSHKLKVPRQEFRRSHRVDARLPCLCQRMQDKIVVPHIVHGAIRDIGYHGLLVELIEPLEPHSEIKLEFELPLVDYRVADVYARVVTLKQEGDEWVAGLEFTSISAECRAKVQMFVQLLVAH